MNVSVVELAPTVDAAALACRQIIGTVLLEGMQDSCRVLVPDDMVRIDERTVWKLMVELDAAEEAVTLPALGARAVQSGVTARMPGGGGEGWHRPYVIEAVVVARLPQLVAIVRADSARRQTDRDATAIVAGARGGRPVVELAGDAARLAERLRTMTALPDDPCMTLATVQRESVTWLSYGRLARGKITMLDGLPGLGKSMVTVDWLARVTTGRSLPGDLFAPAAADVLILAHEDGAGDTLRPRAEAAGADLTRIHLWAADDVPRLPGDMDRIADTIRRHHVAMVVIDPVVAYLDAAYSANSDQDVRRALLPLAQVATDTGTCVVLVRHLRKSGGTALERGGGSIGWAGLARVVLTVGADPDDPETCVVAVAKCNVAKRAPSLRYRIVDAGGAGRVEWLGECRHSADDVTADPTDRTARGRKVDAAADYLRRVLADGQWHRQREIESGAASADIAERTLRRAREDAGVTCRQMDGGWWWHLPPAGGQLDAWPSGHLPEGGQERESRSNTLAPPGGQVATVPHTPSTDQVATGEPEDGV